MIRRVVTVLVSVVALNAMGMLTARDRFVTLVVAWVLLGIVPAVVLHVRERRS